MMTMSRLLEIVRSRRIDPLLRFRWERKYSGENKMMDMQLSVSQI
jgi:hypothetical protein